MAGKAKKIKNDEKLTVERFTYEILNTLGIDVRFNTILQRMEYTKGAAWQQWTDADDLRWLEVQAKYEHPDLRSERKILQAIYKHAHANPINPIKEYLLSCPTNWNALVQNDHIYIDGIPPTPGRLIAEYIDSEMDKKVIGDIFDAWLVGCVQHGLNPEHNPWAGATICPILVGPQGCNKSRFTSWLGQAAGKEYYNESIIDADNKDNRIALATTWIWAADEFSGTMIKSKSETIKNFLSRKEITERLPYAKHPQTRPRLASLIGTDNDSQPLRDTTGNRRFAVIHIERVRLEELQKVLPLDRLWGGAIWLEKTGWTPMIGKSSQQVVNVLNEEAVQTHPWTDTLKERLKFDDLGECTFSDIFSAILGVSVPDQTIQKKRELGQILGSLEFQQLGVRRAQKKVDGKNQKIWLGCKI